MPALDPIFRNIDDEGKGLSKNDFKTRYLYSTLGNKGLLKTMSSPPVITIGTSTSSINTNYVNGGVVIPITDDRIVKCGSIFSEPAGIPAARTPRHITLSTGSKIGNLCRMRFITDAPAFELCLVETQAGRINVLVDGEIGYREDPVRFRNTGNIRYIKFDFGANVTTYSKASAPTAMPNKGAGYVLGEVVTVDGGTNGATGTPATFVVTQVNAGQVQAVSVLNKGNYNTLPTGVLSQVSSTGAGTGLTINAEFFNRRQSTKKMRKIEILYYGYDNIYGIVTRSDDTFLPYPINDTVPISVFVGDSQNEGLSYLDYAGGQIGSRIAQKLGLFDTHIISAQGGTGWNKDAGTALRWSAPQRIADLIAHQGDVYFFIGSQNDTSGTALTTSVTQTLNAIRDAIPKAIFIGIGNVVGGDVNVSNSIKQGFINANDQERTFYIDNQSPTPWLPQSFITTYWTVTNDAAHIGQGGMDIFADIAAYHIDKVLSQVE